MAARGQRRRKKRASANRGAALIIILVLGFAIVIGVRIRNLSEERTRYQQQEEQLESQVAEEESRGEDLKDYKAYVKTKEYIEKIARERLGLVGSDETIVKPDK